jgi:ElaB/YqjD/DUF883 family membrane-anchored ribosome-binding protein
MADREDGKMSGSERSADEIRNDISARRESISRTVDRLGERIHETLDWKGYIARYPYASIGVAVGAGVIVGSLMRRRSRPSERIVDALVDKMDELGDDLRDSVRKLFLKTAAPGLFKGTIYGFAGKALMQYLQARAAHVAGNGGNLAHDAGWGQTRPSPQTPSSIS